MEHTENKLYLKTPLIESILLTSNLSDNEEIRKVYLKLENVQPCGSFKLRGISNLIIKSMENGCNQLISSSGGNAGLAAAYTSMKLNLPLSLFVPETTSEKVRKQASLMGANVSIHGAGWEEADAKAREMHKNTPNSLYIHPFDDPLIWDGHSTMIEEIKEQLNGIKPDCIICSVGGGGLICGVIEGLIKTNWIDSDINIIAVETEGADCFNLTVKNGKLITMDKITSIAKTLGARTCSSKAFEYYQKYSEKIQSIVVSDKEAANACLRFLDEHKFLVEPSCGASLAVAYNAKSKLKKLYKNTVVIVCGGYGITFDDLLDYKCEFDL